MGKRGFDHKRAQRMGRLRDGEICQICGRRGHTEGHHLLDYQFGGKAETDNIITLCRDCHDKVHRGIMDIFRL